MRTIITGLMATTTALALTGQAMATDLTPPAWPADVRAAAERSEAGGMVAKESHVYSGRNGAISAIASPVAVAAGLETLKHGGNAADAATAVAMTQITMQVGSVVSYAGIMSLVYYEAKTGKVHALDAGYNSYRGETDPATIPQADLGTMNDKARTGAAGGGNLAPVDNRGRQDLGRETLVAGYMAGFEAMQHRFGRLKWADLLAPAIWYAENGVAVNPSLYRYFNWRKNFLERTAEGRAWLHPDGAAIPNLGERFYQPEAAKTLRQVALQGARYMYTGAWAHDFVTIVGREGGKVSAADLADYRPAWSEPLSGDFAGTRVYAPGGESFAAYNILPSLNLAEATGLRSRAPYWSDPASFVTITRIVNAMEGAPTLPPQVAAALTAKGIDHSPAALLSPAFAARLAPLLDRITLPASANSDDHHSNSIVVVDKEGNVAAITHTINSVVWGSTGIVVGGIPIPDSAGFQQQRLAHLKPGARLPNEMVQTIVTRNGKPIFATAGIGAALVPESLKLVLGVVGQGRSLAEVQAAPPLLTTFPLHTAQGAPGLDVAAVPQGSYGADFLARAKAAGVAATEIPTATAAGLRGTVVAVQIDPATGERKTADTAGVLIFGGVY